MADVYTSIVSPIPEQVPITRNAPTDERHALVLLNDTEKGAIGLGVTTILTVAAALLEIQLAIDVFLQKL